MKKLVEKCFGRKCPSCNMKFSGLASKDFFNAFYVFKNAKYCESTSKLHAN